MNKFKNALVIVGKALLLILIALAVLLVISLLFSALLFVMLLMGKQVTQSDIMLYAEKIAMIAQLFIIILAVLITYLLFDKKRGLYLGWKQKRWWQLALQGCLWGIAFVSTSFLIVWAIQGIVITDISFNMNILKSMIYPFILFIGVAISEEYLSRGYLHGLIKRDFGAKASIIVNSLLFALLHITNPGILQSPLPLINLMLAGILFGVAREATGGLWLPIGIHFTWNFFMGNIYGIAVSGMDIGSSVITSAPKGHPIIAGGDFGLEGSIITSIVLIVYTIVIWKFYHNKKTDDSKTVMAKEAQ